MAVLITFHENAFLDPNLMLSGDGENSPLSGFPEFQNEHVTNQKTGVTKTNVGRLDPLEMLNVDLQLLDDTKRAYFLNFYRGGYGSGIGFRFRVPYDYTMTIHAFGVSDGVKTQFKLYKTYPRPGGDTADVRRISKPVVQQAKEKNNYLLLAPNGVNPRTISTPFKVYLNTGAGPVEVVSGWTVDCKTGIVYFAAPPAAGTLSCTCEFDIPAAFLPPTPQQRYDMVSSITGIGIREVPIAELGIAY